MGERAFVQIPLRELQTGETGSAQGVRLLYTGWYMPLKTAGHKTAKTAGSCKGWINQIK
jgi:hypothetical protein